MTKAPKPDAVCDGGDLDCGSGLLLIIRSAMQPLAGGGVLEVRSREISVREDLPAWCRMVGHTILATEEGENRYVHYFLRKKTEANAPAVADAATLAQDLEEARRFTWRVRARWNEGMLATAYARNHAIKIGQPASFDTEDAAPSAIEVLLAALAGCLAVGFQWRASRAGIEVHQLEVSLKASADNILVFLGIENEGHPGLARIEGKAYVDATAEDDVLAELWRETIARSPVAQSLMHTAVIDVELAKT